MAKGKTPTNDAEVAVMPPTEVRPAQESTSVESFIAKAIEMNVPVETLERLFALRKEAKAEQAKEA